MKGGSYASQTGSRFYYRADEKLGVVQRYDFRVGSSASLGSWEEYWYDALGRRILTRARRSGSPPTGNGNLCNDPVGNSCQSYWQRSVWDGDQLLYEWRTPDGSTSGMNSGYAGYVHVEGLDQPLGLIRSDGTRVLNYNWRGLGESSVFTNGAPGDASIFGGTVAVDWPTRTQGGVYFTPNVLASGPSGPFTWFGTLAENGAGSTGLLYKRNRYFDPVSGRFTQADPIGLGGGLNLYGFANGDPVNFSDPFGLCMPWPACALAAGRIGSGVGTLVGAGVGALGGGVGAVPGALIGNRIGWVIGVAGATLGAIYVANQANDGWEGLGPDELIGKSPEEIDEKIPETWVREPSRTGGTRYKHPENHGEQIRVQPGRPTDPNPAKQGPYCRISRCGNTSDPIPLKGNPRLPQQ